MIEKLDGQVSLFHILNTMHMQVPFQTRQSQIRLRRMPRWRKYQINH